MTHLPKAPRYFGCVGRPGHHVYNPSLAYDKDMHWLAMLDGMLAPDTSTEGIARLHNFNGCTLLAFWDRSEDSRPGSNSVFYVSGRKTFEEVVEAAKQSFPGIWARFNFNVVLES